MISTYNSKAMDSLVDINVLKDQLGAVLKEVYSDPLGQPAVFEAS